MSKVPACFDLQAIFELSRGEHDLIEDLQLARKVGIWCGLAHRLCVTG